MRERYDESFAPAEMANIFSAAARVQQMLRFEAALAHAQAEAGIITRPAANAIVAACRIELFDVEALYREAATAGTLTIPLVQQLKTHVSEEGRAFVHFGATSQDTIDTALVLQMREGLNVLVKNLLGVCESCARLAEQHRETTMAGRTLLQHALPIPFGLKAARWLALAARQALALRARRNNSLVLQFGGAAGTLAALRDAGMIVAHALAKELKVPLPELPWHAERDRIAAVACALGVTAGAMAKIANDVVLLAQTEVAEVSEAGAPGKGGSSALPQKRNPVDAMMALASAKLATGSVSVVLSSMANEHERAAGGWQSEWVAMPDLFGHTASAVERVRNLLSGLVVNPERMRRNLEFDGGLLMAESLSIALQPQLGREAARDLVQLICRRVLADGSTLRQAALDEPKICAALSPEAIELALDPESYCGSAGVMIDRALAFYRESKSELEGA